MKPKEFIKAHEYQQALLPKVNSLEAGLLDFIKNNPTKCDKAKSMYRKFFRKEVEL